MLQRQFKVRTGWTEEIYYIVFRSVLFFFNNFYWPFFARWLSEKGFEVIFEVFRLPSCTVSSCVLALAHSHMAIVHFSSFKDTPTCRPFDHVWFTATH